MIKLETITKDGDKVLAQTIAKKFNISIDELISYAEEKGIKIKFAQQILTLPEAVELALFIEDKIHSLHFGSREWVSNSSIDDFQNLITFIDDTNEIINRQMKLNSKTLSTSNRLYKELKRLQVRSKELEALKLYLLPKFDFSLTNLKERLFFMKSEALEYLEDVDSSFSIWDDQRLSSRKIDFYFSATKIVRLYDEQIKKIKNYSKEEAFFKRLFEAFKSLQKEDEKFFVSSKTILLQSLKDGYLDDFGDKIYQEWADEVSKIDRFYLKVVKGYFVGKISEELLFEMFDILSEIKYELEEFYIDNRSGLIVKYKDNTKSKLLEELDTRIKIYQIHQKAKSKIIKVMRERESLVASTLLNEIINELLEFKVKGGSKKYKDIYQKMEELHSKNLEIYLDDLESYTKELEKRELEISKCIFKIQRDLEE